MKNNSLVAKLNDDF